MKIILTQEVTGLGQPGDVVEVKDGYGRNYLLPRGVAIRWTRGGEKTVESIKKARSSRAVRDQEHADQLKGKLEAAPVDVKVKAGSAGRLFGAVTTTEIAGALAAVAGEEVDRRAIALGNPIKTLGAHPPGSLVKLNSGEVAVVVRRPAAGLHPVAATLSDRHGRPAGETHRRNTAEPEFGITAAMHASKDFSRIPPERVYGLVDS